MDSGPYTGLTSDAAIEKMNADAAGERFWRGGDDLPAERLGNFAAAVLGHADSD